MAAEAMGAGGQVIGIDPGPAMVAKACRGGRRTGSRAEFKLAAIEQLPFADASFDVVLSSLMLHHLPPEAKTQGLDEVYRVLKPGGRLLAVDIDRPALSLWWLVLWPARRMPMVAPHLHGEIPEYLYAAGFDPIKPVGRWFKLLTFWLAVKPFSV
jgi:demethylmenaquinone methyltransferase/2-methoxy-6-polyprenyl-1,4-benzoquinol methylase/phosphoethanolamine N-methyltransferase